MVNSFLGIAIIALGCWIFFLVVRLSEEKTEHEYYKGLYLGGANTITQLNDDLGGKVLEAHQAEAGIAELRSEVHDLKVRNRALAEKVLRYESTLKTVDSFVGSWRP